MRVVTRSVFAALVLVSACFTSDATPTGIPGTYRLTAVDAAPLPFNLGSAVTLRGQLDLRSGGQYTLTQTDSAAAGATNFSSSGTWSVTDNAITFHDDVSTLLLGLALRDSVRLTYHSHTNVYVRQ
ncbi:MAG TPA: hypothetical protein VK636_13115 [Gemmatimonadaceae bacterium]|nr:hypothetical protein [Gemmatimonadaceae bacterium]